MNILITSAGQRVSLVRLFKKELLRIYPGQKVFAADLRPAFSAACQVADAFFEVPPVTDPTYIPLLLEYCRQYRIGMVVPTIDTELKVLAESRHLFVANGIHLIISSPDFVDICRDKRKTNVFFAGKDIETPAAVNKHQPVFPFFIKPFNGSLSADTFIIRDPSQITAWHMQNEQLMFMEYLDKTEYDEYTVDMYYNDRGMLRCLVPRKRLMVRAGEISKGVTCNNKLVPYLSHRLHRIDGARGCLTAQFFLHRTNGRIVGIEINARFGGGYPLSYHAGANYPRWLLQEYFLGMDLPPMYNWEDKLLMLRYDDEIIIHGNKD
jgi:carbamoyl-phosphate synthase large subunit